MGMKICSKCGDEKPLSQFHKRVAAKDGLHPHCKTCACLRAREYGKSYYEQNKDARKAYAREHGSVYRANNKEAIRERRVLIRTANLEQRLKQESEYRKNNREKIAETSTRWANNNRAATRKGSLQVYRRNKPRYLAQGAKYRAAKKQAVPLWFEKDEVELLYKCAASQRKTGLDVHVDHIIPLQSSVVCGLHCMSNLQILSSIENRQKGNRFNTEA